MSASAGFASSSSAKRTARTYATGGTAPLATALVDPWLFNSQQTSKAFALTRAAGASYVRVTINWSGIAPERPAYRFRRDRPDVPRLLVG